MAPSFLNFKELRRRSRASFRTERSTDTSSNGGDNSHNTTPTDGSVTPPSISAQSDPALHLQVKDQSQPPPLPPNRPPLGSYTNRWSVSGMAGLGSPSINGKGTLPVSQYAPQISNLTENAWVCALHSIAADPPACLVSLLPCRIGTAVC